MLTHVSSCEQNLMLPNNMKLAYLKTLCKEWRGFPSIIFQSPVPVKQEAINQCKTTNRLKKEPTLFSFFSLKTGKKIINKNTINQSNILLRQVMESVISQPLLVIASLPMATTCYSHNTHQFCSHVQYASTNELGA